MVVCLKNKSMLGVAYFVKNFNFLQKILNFVDFFSYKLILFEHILENKKLFPGN